MTFINLFKTLNENKVLILLISLVTVLNAWNMFNYPFFSNDETIYSAQGWAVYNLNQLSIYTYWYDHAPVGWMLIGLFYKITENFYQIGDMAVSNGRVFTLILGVVVNVLLAKLSFKFTNSKLAVYFCIIFSNISLIALSYHRLVVLDNIMMFWFLISVSILVLNQMSLIVAFTSALTFGLSILSKESAVIFLPAMIYYLVQRTTKSNRAIIMSLYGAILGSVLGMYVMLAVLKTELFPSPNKVSLIGTILFHSKRGNQLPIWDFNSEFSARVGDWWNIDPAITVIFLLSILTPILAYYFRKKINMENFIFVYLMQFVYFLFLIRGGTVLNIYFIPVLSITPLILVIVFQPLWKFFEVSKIRFKYGMFVIVAFMLMTQFHLFRGDAFFMNQNIYHRQSLKWIRDNVDSKSIIAIDNTWEDLNNPKNVSGKVFPNAELFFKFDYDIEIKEGLIKNDYRNIKYVVGTNPLYEEIKSGRAPLLKKTLDNSKLLESYESGKNFVVDHSRYYSVNGDWSSIWRVNDNQDIINKIYKQSLAMSVNDAGRVTNSNTGFTYSTEVAENLYKSMISNDRESFDKILNWANANIKRPDNLYSSQYGLYLGETKILNKSSNTKADTQIAFSLIKAGEKWSNSEYINQAKAISTNIWNNARQVGKDYEVLLPNSDKFIGGPDIEIDPSSFNPYFVSAFGTYDNNNWQKVISTSYKLYNSLLDQHVLFPKKALLNTQSGNISLIGNDANANIFGEDSFTTLLQIKQDVRWNPNIINKDTLSRLESRIVDIYNKYGQIPAQINPDGTTLNKDYSDSMVNTAGMVVLSEANEDLYTKMFRIKNSNRVNLDNTYTDTTSRNLYYTWYAFANHEGVFDKK
jgi:endo-1,4-beta-D-glucanase Y